MHSARFPEKPKRSRILRYGILVVVIFVLFDLALLLVLSMGKFSYLFKLGITHTYSDGYATDGKHVYFLDGRYRRVEGADPTTFRLLVYRDGQSRNYSPHLQMTGRDKDAVFVGTERLDRLNPDTTVLLENGYLTDGTLLYYRDVLAAGADPRHFRHIIGHYADDGKRLYYKGLIVAGADVASLAFVTEKAHPSPTGIAAESKGPYRNSDGSRKDLNYLRDAHRVYYHDRGIPGADPATFRIVDVLGDQWGLHYAGDRHGYYFEGVPLPDQAAGAGEKIAPGSLTLLQADRNFGWVELFYTGRNVYVFDTKERALKLLFTRETDAPFEAITRGVFRDDSNVYFSGVRNRRRRSNARRRLLGKYSFFQPLDGVRPEDFTLAWVIDNQPARKRAEIFEANGIYYYHPRYADNASALAFLEPDGMMLKSGDYFRSAARDEGKPPVLRQIPRKKEFTYYQSFENFPTLRRSVFLIVIASFFVAAIASEVVSVRGQLRKRKI